MRGNNGDTNEVPITGTLYTIGINANIYIAGI